MTDRIGRPAISTRAGTRLAPAAALAAAVLAAIPLVLSRVDGDGDLDPFFAALFVAAVAVAVQVSLAPARPVARLIGTLIVLAWFAAGAAIAFLLVMERSACGCSSPDPSSFPPAPTYAGLPATAYHLLATYGGGFLVAAAVALSGGPGPGRYADRRDPSDPTRSARQAPNSST